MGFRATSVQNPDALAVHSKGGDEAKILKLCITPLNPENPDPKNTKRPPNPTSPRLGFNRIYPFKSQKLWMPRPLSPISPVRLASSYSANYLGALAASSVGAMLMKKQSQTAQELPDVKFHIVDAAADDDDDEDEDDEDNEGLLAVGCCGCCLFSLDALLLLLSM